MIRRLVLVSEDRAANNAADTAHADEGCRAQRSLPLSADVVGLVRQDAGHVGVAGDGREEDAEVAHAAAFGEAEEGEAWGGVLV